jgi:hypothetical protein
MKRMHLSQRLSAVFAVLLLACCGASAWLQVQANQRHEQEVIQRLSRGLAAHIAGHSTLMEANGLNLQAVPDLFGKLMDVNPSVEVYLLSQDGQIEAQAAPAGHVKRQRVAMSPIHRLLAGEPLPVFGDDPRSDNARKVFSAAPLLVNGRAAGYVYVVLLGEHHDVWPASGSRRRHRAPVVMALVAGSACLQAVAFWMLARCVDLRMPFIGSGPMASQNLQTHTSSRKQCGRGRIGSLRLAYAQMTRRIAERRS